MEELARVRFQEEASPQKQVRFNIDRSGEQEVPSGLALYRGPDVALTASVIDGRVDNALRYLEDIQELLDQAKTRLHSVPGA